uniref:Uncharacterized protein n=1 Tax=Vitis vinifera TaxID=29760 RepID=A5BNE3_VITVI|nr:hypothetical protein VITISV_028329 [Vitis vinifera]
MDVSVESKSLSSVGYSRKSYLQITSQRLVRDKLVHLNGWRSLALSSVGPGDFGDLDNKYLKQNISKYPKISVANIRKLQENTAALYKIACETLLVGAIRGSGYVRPEKLKSSPFLSGVSIPDVNIRVEVCGSQMQWQHTPGCKWRQLGIKWRRTSGCKWRQLGINGGSRVQLQICGPDALRWCIRTPCPSILLA